jgi:hypothetical protein
MGSTPRGSVDPGAGRLGPRIPGRPGFLERVFDEGVEADMEFGETRGYGPRDPEADDVPRVAWESARLRARIEYVAFLLLSGATPFVLIAMVGVEGGLGAALLALVAMPHLTIPGLLCLAVGVWYAAGPVIAWDWRGLRLRHRPWRAATRVAPADLLWRPGARYVGRYLLAKPLDRKPVRFPLWMIRRSGARRLFAYLDRVVPDRS